MVLIEMQHPSAYSQTTSMHNYIMVTNEGYSRIPRRWGSIHVVYSWTLVFGNSLYTAQCIYGVDFNNLIQSSKENDQFVISDTEKVNTILPPLKKAPNEKENTVTTVYIHVLASKNIDRYTRCSFVHWLGICGDVSCIGFSIPFNTFQAISWRACL